MSNAQTPVISFEKLRQDHWNAQETQNAATVVDFFQNLMNAHDFDYTLRTFGGGDYVQHNRSIPDQISGLIGYIKTLTKRFPEYAFDVKRIHCDGDYVILHSHATLKAVHRGDETKGFVITDTFRIEDGRLQEHWDAVQPIDFFARMIVLLTGGKVANANATF